MPAQKLAPWARASAPMASTTRRSRAGSHVAARAMATGNAVEAPSATPRGAVGEPDARDAQPVDAPGLERHLVVPLGHLPDAAADCQVPVEKPQQLGAGQPADQLRDGGVEGQRAAADTGHRRGEGRALRTDRVGARDNQAERARRAAMKDRTPKAR